MFVASSEAGTSLGNTQMPTLPIVSMLITRIWSQQSLREVQFLLCEEIIYSEEKLQDLANDDSKNQEDIFSKLTEAHILLFGVNSERCCLTNGLPTDCGRDSMCTEPR